MEIILGDENKISNAHNISAVLSLDFYLREIDLPWENLSKFTHGKIILGFNFTRSKGHTNPCHQCLG